MTTHVSHVQRYPAARLALTMAFALALLSSPASSTAGQVGRDADKAKLKMAELSVDARAISVDPPSSTFTRSARARATPPKRRSPAPTTMKVVVMFRRVI